jgi:hypothetical protein
MARNSIGMVGDGQEEMKDTQEVWAIPEVWDSRVALASQEA